MSDDGEAVVALQGLDVQMGPHSRPECVRLRRISSGTDEYCQCEPQVRFGWTMP